MLFGIGFWIDFDQVGIKINQKSIPKGMKTSCEKREPNQCTGGVLSRLGRVFGWNGWGMGGGGARNWHPAADSIQSPKTHLSRHTQTPTGLGKWQWARARARAMAVWTWARARAMAVWTLTLTHAVARERGGGFRMFRSYSASAKSFSFC